MKLLAIVLINFSHNLRTSHDSLRRNATLSDGTGAISFSKMIARVQQVTSILIVDGNSVMRTGA